MDYLDRKEKLKEIIKQLHAGVDPQKIREKFKQVLEGVSPLEISKIEQELIEEGVPREEIQRLCEVHLAVFREQLEKQKLTVPAGHPINILMEEHKVMLQLSERLVDIAKKIKGKDYLTEIGSEMEQLRHIAEEFSDSEKHYLREENVLFPFLEKHGITEPPAIMWMEHDQIREKKKQLKTLTEKISPANFQTFKEELEEIAAAMQNLLSSHFYKENNILFPTALRVISNEEWRQIREEFDHIGYCCFTPPQATIKLQIEKAEKIKAEVEAAALPGKLEFETGTLSRDEVEAILNTLPVDITFVDKDDVVRYFNKAEGRIFVRTKAVIGRKVQQCHPQKSIHVVNRILNAFKTGKKDAAEFWIQMNNRLIHIRYFAVRNKNGEYLGTLEVTQDITDIKKIEGEKRLLDWKG